MPHQLSLNQQLDRAIAHFPYPLELLGCPAGTNTPYHQADVQAEQGCLFVAGHILQEEIVAAGWISLDGPPDSSAISAAFGLFLGESSLLVHRTLNATYDLERETWGEFFLG